MSRTSSLRRKLWMVPKSNISDVQALTPFLIDPSLISEWPMGIDPDGIYVVDSCVEQHKLGPNVMDHFVTM